MTCKHKRAFSLIELMAAVGILSILVTLAVPRYRAFIARGRMAEAKVNLGHIAALQGIYRAEWNKYATIAVVGRVNETTHKCDETADFINPLGFAPNGCEDLRYGYNSDSSFKATAKAGQNVKIYPSCPSNERDEWEVTKDNFKVKQVKNIVEHCD